jgi:hypothetical protein
VRDPAKRRASRNAHAQRTRERNLVTPTGVSRARCGACGKNKEASAFYTERRRKSGLSWACRSCLQDRRAQQKRNARTRSGRGARHRQRLARRRLLLSFGRMLQRLLRARTPRPAAERVPRVDWSRDLHCHGLTQKQARAKLNMGVALGWIIKPSSCERCNQPTVSRRLHGHHDDYDYPLRVEWLCRECHSIEHGRPC